MQVSAIALKERVRRNRQENVKIARRSAPRSGFTLASEPDAGSILDPGRDVDRERALTRPPARARARAARIFDHLSAAVTGRTGALEREEALRMPDLALPAAGRAG